MATLDRAQIEAIWASALNDITPLGTMRVGADPTFATKLLSSLQNGEFRIKLDQPMDLDVQRAFLSGYVALMALSVAHDRASKDCAATLLRKSAAEAFVQ